MEKGESKGMYWVFISVMAKGQMSMIITLKKVGVQRDATEPQSIPCSGCGSWMLLDIIGEKTTESVKVLSLDDKIGFGKYKDMPLKNVTMPPVCLQYLASCPC